MRLIDADALIERLDERKRKEPGIRNIADILRVQSFIDSQPTACDVSCGYTKEDIELNRKAAYNKAIDDFIHECDKLCGFYNGGNRIITREDMLKISEKFKAGGENEMGANFRK